MYLVFLKVGGRYKLCKYLKIIKIIKLILGKKITSKSFPSNNFGYFYRVCIWEMLIE